MLPTFHWSDYLVFGISLICYSLIGIYHRYHDVIFGKLTNCFRGINFQPKVRKKMNVEELFLGDRNLTLLPIVGSVMASFLSAVGILGTASEAYQCGIQFITLVGGYCIAFPLAAYVYMPVFYKLRLNSAHEYLEMRFGKLVRWTASLVFLLQMTVYIALALYAPALAFSQGDFSIDPFKRHTLWTLIIGGTGLVLSIFGANQTQIQRYMACRDLKTARRAILLNIPLTSVFLAVQLFTGLAIYAYFAGCDPVLNGSIKRYDQILPYIVMILFDGVLLVRGIFLSVIFAAALSTVSSGVNSLANVCLEDLIRPLYIHWRHVDISERSKYRLAIFLGINCICYPVSLLHTSSLSLFYSSWCAGILFGTLTVSLAFIFTLSSSHILQISFSLFGAIGGPVLTVFTAGIFFPCINAEGGLCALISGVICGLWICIGNTFITSRTNNDRLPLTIENCSSKILQNISSSIVIGTMNTSITTGNIIKTTTWSFYSLSYLYYATACLIVGIPVGFIISAITGKLLMTLIEHPSLSLLNLQLLLLHLTVVFTFVHFQKFNPISSTYIEKPENLDMKLPRLQVINNNNDNNNNNSIHRK
ncbi:solute carrier family 5 (sodium-coupled monocarboxylate transporter), member 8/12 [Schistosoma bovis]|uniref:Solute carrier family 5 (Sodium-coupled monocarboxylate transporter), member 8/12 n=1 Tax=Schistosoma bovis TaxID=6184 RepID=A0A430QHD9_SCHBO|nr:solute carrier family 5 (sodium-coupled monocarboxylate transporter), member 8/12 [Schistosoma bovis]